MPRSAFSVAGVSGGGSNTVTGTPGRIVVTDSTVNIDPNATPAFGLLCGGVTSNSILQSPGLGTVGQTLVSQGPGSLPSWQAPSSDMMALSQGQADNVASIVITGLNANYRAYMLVFTDLLPQNNGDNLLMQFSTDNGATFINSAGYYVWTRSATSSSVITTEGQPDTALRVSSSCGAETSYAYSGANGYLYIFSAYETYATKVTGASNYISGGGVQIGGTTYAYAATNPPPTGVNVADQHNAFQLYFSTGNINHVTYTLYGLTKS